MYIPEDESIEYLLHQYASLFKENEDAYNAKDISFKEYYDAEEKYRNLYVQAIKLIFSKSNLSYCDLMPLDYFISCAKCGSFIPYDGTGYYVDAEGNELGYINWYNIADCPENAVYIAWYNK